MLSSRTIAIEFQLLHSMRLEEAVYTETPFRNVHRLSNNAQVHNQTACNTLQYINM